MEASGDELGRIVAFVNRRPWLMEAPQVSASADLRDDCDPACSSYFLDRMGTTSFGDSCLHRICAWHPTPDQFKTFMNHIQAHQHDNKSYLEMPLPPSLGQTNHKGVTAIHVAVYRNSFHANSIVKQLLEKEPSLASTAMECGSYPLHILCAHNVTIRRDILMTLLDADPTVVWKEDQHGDTPLSLLWKNVLRFRWAQQEQVAFKEEEDDEDLMDIDITANINNNPRRRRRRPSWMTVITPDQYVELSLMMIRAALHKPPQLPLHLVDICKMPRCPPLLLKLVLQLQKNEISNHLLPGTHFWRDPDMDSGMTALHHAARVDPVTREFVPAHVQLLAPVSVVDCLLDHFPVLALVKDHSGRIALHYALEKAFCEHGGDECKELLYRLVNANPDSLRIKDPVSGLYPFALLAAQSASTSSDDGMQVMDEAAPQSVDHLETIFRLIRDFPEAALYRE
jgi:ankyrin repeat protein